MTNQHHAEDELPVTSSQRPELPAEQEKLFHEVLDLLETKKIPLAVSGTFALQEHTGICRWTKDLDIFLTARNARLAMQYLAERGFECEVKDPVWLNKAHRGDFFVDLITGMSNGLISVDDTWMQRTKPATIYGVKTRVLGAEEVIASKLFVIRRERFDGADICHAIYGTRGKLDWPRIMTLAGDHWEILLWSLVLYRYIYPAQTNYVPPEIWKELLDRFTAAVTNPDPQAKFRGSLVDDRMFAIDVKEWGLEDVLEDCRTRAIERQA